MTCSLVFVNYSFVGHAVYDWHSLVIGHSSLLIIFGFNCSHYFFDIGSHHGTKAGVVSTAIFGLFSAFAGLCSVCQGRLLEFVNSGFRSDFTFGIAVLATRKKTRTMLFWAGIVKSRGLKTHDETGKHRLVPVTCGTFVRASNPNAGYP